MNSVERVDSVDSRAQLSATWRYPASLRAVADARNAVADVLYAGGHAAVAEDCRLAVSELATNAITHAASPFEVRVRFTDTVRLEVADQSSELPVLRSPSAFDGGGRGCRIVDALATRWGAEPAPGGKVVWAEFSGPVSSPCPPPADRARRG